MNIFAKLSMYFFCIMIIVLVVIPTISDYRQMGEESNISETYGLVASQKLRNRKNSLLCIVSDQNKYCTGFSTCGRLSDYIGKNVEVKVFRKAVVGATYEGVSICSPEDIRKNKLLMIWVSLTISLIVLIIATITKGKQI